MQNSKLCKCKDCQKEVSKNAKTCPHCGVKDPSIKISDAIGGFIVLAIIVLLFVGLIVFIGLGVDKFNSDKGEVLQKNNDKPASDTAKQKEIDNQSSMLVLCDNYFRKKIAVYKGSKLHTFLGHRSTFIREKDIKFVIEATVVNAFGAEQKVSVGCYVNKNHKPDEYNNYSDITSFEVYDY